MNIKNNIQNIRQNLPSTSQLIAVSKTHPVDVVKAAYEAGQRVFGENKVQEMINKYEALPKDIEWHMIGHLQRNKVKYIASFVTLIHAVDSMKLLEEINKQGEKIGRVIRCLIQVHIATEETKFGFSPEEVLSLLQNNALPQLSHVQIEGLMGMATFTDDVAQVRKEFRALKSLFDTLRQVNLGPHVKMHELSMGMSSDYLIAAEEGSTMVRIGSAIFGSRNYQ